MTGTYVALLRGINVGKAKRIAMADLRELFEGLGFTGVRTVLNSGNVVFHAAEGAPKPSAASIAKALEAELGVSAPVTVVSGRDWARIVAENPLLEVAKDPSRLLVTFPATRAQREALAELAKKRWTPDALVVGKLAAYAWCAKGILDSALWPALERELGRGVTSRNWATVMKIHAFAST